MANDIKKVEEKQMANVNNQALSAETLIAQAIDKNVPFETMEKLLAMRRELKAEWAKEEYDKAMASFQAGCPTIQKTREVKTNTGQTAYRYAPIESIVDQVKEQLKENGFSYSTNMMLLENGVKVMVKVTHKAGHSEITEMEVPFGNKTNVMSQTQVVAAAQTFAKRYAFCNAFGILTGDEDNDAISVNKKEVGEIGVSSPTEKQIKFISQLLNKKGFCDEDLYIKYSVKSKKDLTKDQASQIIENLMKLPNADPSEIVDPEEADKAIEEGKQKPCEICGDVNGYHKKACPNNEKLKETIH